MPTIAATSRPAYVYDSQTDTWVPIGIGPHTHPQYIDTTFIDGKGEIIVGTAPDTAGKLPVGTNGQVLIVDSSTDTGIAWTDIDALPDQTNNEGKFLTTDGTTASWATVSPDSDQFILASQIFGDRKSVV